MPTSKDSLEQALELLTAPPSAAHIQGLGARAVAELEAQRGWTNSRNIVGYGVARRTQGGQETDDLSVKVYVSTKVAKEEIPPQDRVPSTVDLPTLPAAVPLDVEEIGIPVLQSLATRMRPLVPGYSVGLLGGETGTIGALVRKKGTTGPLLLLSNSHVLANNGNASKGAAIVQPGPGDGGQPADNVAAVDDWVGFNFEPGYNNLCDAAVASLEENMQASCLIPQIGTPKGINTDIPLGTQVQKTGRTTEHTVGVVKDASYRTFMDYPKADGSVGSAGFRNQVLCTRYSEPGDSGSLVCDMNDQAVGLHWCGSDKVSVFSPISFVLDALGLELVTDG